MVRSKQKSSFPNASNMQKHQGPPSVDSDVADNDTVPEFGSHVGVEFMNESETMRLPSMSPINDTMNFTLKTSAGALFYQPNDSNYTDFLRVTIGMLLAFNPNDIDSDFKQTLETALKCYETGDQFAASDDENDSDEFEQEQEEEDPVLSKLEQAKKHVLQIEEANKLISRLPDSGNVEIQILSTDESGTQANKLISKHLGLPDSEIDEIVTNHKPFHLSVDKGKDLYKQLRMSDVILSIKPVYSKSTETEEPVENGLKRSSAAKNKNPKSTQKLSGKTKLTDTTGKEKLKDTVGVIK